MASVTKRPNGHFWVQFFFNSKRHTIRLGSTNARSASEFASKINRLAATLAVDGIPEPQISRWLNGLDDSVHAKLVACGIAQSRISATLGGLLDHVWSLMAVQSSTLLAYGHARRNLLERFPASMPLANFNQGAADDFRRHLEKSGLASATVGRRLKLAKQFFEEAVKREWIVANPFEKMGWDEANEDRQHFVDAKLFRRIVDRVPNPEIRLVFALARWGGVRVPSEILPLRWSDVDWEKQTMCVWSPKTKRYRGKAFRMVPIFPEVRPYLDAVWDLPGEPEFVISSKRMTGQGYLKYLTRAAKAEGVPELWPKPFQNLRSTRETELMEQFPIHVVCAWIGNSPKIAHKHYLQVTDAHREKALRGEALSEAVVVKNGQSEAKSEAVNDAKNLAADAKNTGKQGFSVQSTPN